MNLNQYIEHTVLKADTAESDVKKLCEEAIENKFLGVCVPPYFVKSARQYLQKTDIKIVTVIGFPLGYSSTPAKVEEAKKAIDEGAHEVDMVINIAALKNEDYNYVINDIQSVTTIVQLKRGKVKVIFETALLTKAEIIKACEICNQVKVDFVKTSTGFSTRGASEEDIKLMKQHTEPSVKIKASGGIKTKAQALKLIESGAERLGTSASIQIVNE
jgi:deoxyribose-phosphate aldolase